MNKKAGMALWKWTAAAVITAAGISYVLMPVSAASALTVEIPYTQVFSTNVSSADDSFAYQIEATCTSAAACPLPDPAAVGTDTFTVNGSVSGHLSIDFAEKGIYTYRIKAIDAAESGYTYDHNIYTIEIYIGNDEGTLIQDALIIKNTEQSKVTQMNLSVSYHEDLPESTDVKVTAVPPYIMVNTGVFSFPASTRSCMAYGIMLILLILFMIQRKKKDRE